METTALTKRTKWLALLSLAGAVVSLYLTYLHFTPEASTICQLGEAFDCDKVNKSVYSTFFGIPVAIMGSGYYIGMLIFSALFSWNTKLFAKMDLKDLFQGIFLMNGAFKPIPNSTTVRWPRARSLVA